MAESHIVGMVIMMVGVVILVGFWLVAFHRLFFQLREIILIGRKVRCSKCNNVFENQSAYLKHYREEHRQWRCSKCNIVLKDESAYHKHYQEH